MSTLLLNGKEINQQMNFNLPWIWTPVSFCIIIPQIYTLKSFITAYNTTKTGWDKQFNAYNYSELNQKPPGSWLFCLWEWLLVTIFNLFLEKKIIWIYIISVHQKIVCDDWNDKNVALINDRCSYQILIYYYVEQARIPKEKMVWLMV